MKIVWVFENWSLFGFCDLVIVFLNGVLDG